MMRQWRYRSDWAELPKPPVSKPNVDRMTFWYAMLTICASLALFAHYKWRQERRGDIQLRVIGSFGPYATGLLFLTALIALRIVLHHTQ